VAKEILVFNPASDASFFKNIGFGDGKMIWRKKKLNFKVDFHRFHKKTSPTGEPIHLNPPISNLFFFI